MESWNKVTDEQKRDAWDYIDKSFEGPSNGGTIDLCL